MDRQQVQYAGGMVATTALLAAEHWFPWWTPLHRLVAYGLGTGAVLLGQGIARGFDRDWWKGTTIALAGGVVVMAAYLYDALARNEAVEASRVHPAHRYG